MSDVARCEWCGKRLDRSASPDARCGEDHPAPDLAERIVHAIGGEIHGRKGIGWEHLDDEIVDEITDELVAVVRRFLADEGKS